MMVFFAFVKSKNGWGVLDPKGEFVFPPCFSSITKAEGYTARHIIALVKSGDGQNILVNNYDRNTKSLAITRGFPNDVDYIVLLEGSILAKNGSEWGVYEWNTETQQYECSVDLGKLDSVEDKLYEIQNEYFRIVKKG